MNQLLKILAAIALVAVIILVAVNIIRKPETDKDLKSKIELHEKTVKELEIKLATPVPEVPIQAVPKTIPATIQTPTPQSTTEKIIIKKDDPIQPSYVAINQPSYLQEIRQVGKTYNSIITGKVSGRASKADWGFKGSCYFQYVYGMEVSSKIISNDGMKIVEERKYSNVRETVLMSDYVIGFYFGDKLRFVLDALGILVANAPFGTPLDGKEIPINQEWINQAQQLKVFDKFPDLKPENIKSHFKACKQLDGKLPLEGKTVVIMTIDGEGVTSIEPQNCGLTQEEKDLIVRSNQLMDYYMFPNREVKPGDVWEVDGNVLGGFLDHRLTGRLNGKVKMERAPDFPAADGDIVQKIRMVEGKVTIVDAIDNSSVKGELRVRKGTAIIPKKHNIITDGSVFGTADYQKVSTDHLLFEAKMQVKPDFEARYQCEVK